MSKVLSIYNSSAFSEYVLPNADNTEYSFVLDSDLFKLVSNLPVDLECEKEHWYFVNEEEAPCTVSEVDTKDCLGKLELKTGRYVINTANGEVLSLIVEERTEPLNVYSKIVLQKGSNLSVGLEQDNTIIYSYMAGGSADGLRKDLVSRHHCVIHVYENNAVLEDLSTNGTYINSIRVNGSQELKFGDSIRVFGLNMVYLGSLMAINRAEGVICRAQELGSKAIRLFENEADEEGSSEKNMFARSPRILPKLNIEDIVIDPAPNPREAANMPLFMQIGPAMTMALPMLLGSGLTIYAARLSGHSNPALMMTGMVTALTSGVIGAFWAIMNVRLNKKNAYESEKKRYEKYGQYLVNKQEEVRKIYEQNTAAYREKYIPSEEIAAFNEYNEKLWSRNFLHSDVLTYRLGLGDMPFPAKIEVPKEKFTMTDDELAEKPQLIQNLFRTMHDVPICVDLLEKNITGVIGDSGHWGQIIKNLIVQIAGNNSYTDVKIAFIYDENRISNSREWQFVKWLPHVWSEDKKIRYFATNKNEANEVLYSLSQVFHSRAEGEHPVNKPYYILFVLNKELLEGELIYKYISDTSNTIGLSTVIAADRYEQLPNNCEFIIENNTSFSGYYNTVDENTEQIPVSFDRISDDSIRRFAKTLSNIEVNEAEGGGGEVPNSITFFEMLGIGSPKELDAASRWRKARPEETMKAVIGFRNGMNPCYLDIHERYHGPHGLVAGTTGSGKSETLQTYMLSLAINYSPNDVGFFIIDYKGGGMANLFSGLPHLIGSISNLSGNQVKRAMVSIKSEIKRRQRMFSEYGVNNINSYTSLFKNGDAKDPIPHMLIIIDEFAELKREEPEFMKELVSVAQVGRSLGVHLILATQKPAGTVDDNIWSNSKFKLCLRVQDRQDSLDVLHRPDAAYLTQAGRGYLQVGNDELFELFQSGYSGAIYDEFMGDKKYVVAQILNSVGKVDLAGNHLKIQHQKEVQNRWITALCESFAEAKADAGNEAADQTSFIDRVYSNISDRGLEYKKTSYNTARLMEFETAFNAVSESGKEADAEAVLEYARENRLRLPEMKNKTQLEAVTEYLADIAETNGYTNNISLWMPLLPEQLALDKVPGYMHDIAQPSKEWSLKAIIGMVDDPENQSQMPVFLDLGENGNYAVCGTVSTGKSTFLQTAIYSFIRKYTPEQVSFYIFDFSNKLLKVFENSKHVGGVMTDAEEDEEKISKFFTMISLIIKERKAILTGSNYQDYIARNRNADLPAIVIALDNYAGFKEKTEEKYEDTIRHLLKEGVNYGIYMIITAGGFGTSEIPSRFADYFRSTISLEMSNPYQYSDIMRVTKVPIYPEANIKGRGLVLYGDRILEFQTAVASEAENTIERGDVIAREIARIDAAYTGPSARKIPVIPDNPTWELYSSANEYRELISRKDTVPIGYDRETAAYYPLDLIPLHSLLVTGTPKSGKSVFMKNLIRAFADKQSDIYIIEPGGSEFSAIAQKTGSKYITDGAGIFAFGKDVLTPEVGVRGKTKLACKNQQMEEPAFYEAMSVFKKICIFIPDMRKFLAEIENNESPAKDARDFLEKIVGENGRNYNVHFFAELGDNDIPDVNGHIFFNNMKRDCNVIRFGGKYASQKLFDFINIPYTQRSNPEKKGIGVWLSDSDDSPVVRIVVPNSKG